MNKRLFVVGVAALAVSLGAIVARGAATEKKASPGKVAGKVRATVEKQAQAVKLPGPVTKTFKRAFPKGEIFRVDVEVENGVTVYDLEFKDGGIEKETDITADGTMLEFTVVVDAKAVPKAAMNAVRKAAQGATIQRIEHVEIAYETKDGKAIKLPKPITRNAVAVATGEKTAEVVVAPDGGVVEPAKWASAFDVDKANLTNVGRNPYFIPLEPGYRLVLKGGGATLTVTVTRRTKLVDGVETRVVEEREEKDGQPMEISQNYFAIDKTTKAVYYFGEDVDVYKEGKVVSHEGAWLSGVNGAKFGMMMPGKPKVGDKFQQEIAPKVAMDRCEIAAIGEEVKTPAGTFKNCLRTKEGSSIEKGTSEKVYAPGVGLIKDDEFVLVKIAKTGAKKSGKAKAK